MTGGLHGSLLDSAKPHRDILSGLTGILARQEAEESVGGQSVREGEEALARVIVEDLAGGWGPKETLALRDEVRRERGDHARDDEVRHAEPEQLVAAEGLESA